jgi:hypothetical protein
VALQQPVVRRAEQQVEHNVGIGARGDLAAVDGPPDQDRVAGPERLEHPLPPRGGQRRVTLGLGDQPGQHPARRGAGHRPDPAAQRGEQVAVEGPGVGQGLLPGELGQEGVERQGAAGSPAPVDRGLAHAGPGGHLLHGHPAEAALGQEFCGGGQDGTVRLLAARPATPSGQAGTHGGVSYLTSLRWNTRAVHKVAAYSKETRRSVSKKVLPAR